MVLDSPRLPKSFIAKLFITMHLVNVKCEVAANTRAFNIFD
jgi:hypothetical protein